jgi:hypothetical protein
MKIYTFRNVLTTIRLGTLVNKKKTIIGRTSYNQVPVPVANVCAVNKVGKKEKDGFQTESG